MIFFMNLLVLLLPKVLMCYISQMCKVFVILSEVNGLSAVSVLARKIYMEGLFKQTTDRKYWEFWNRKKLSSELELKQRRILELNQVHYVILTASFLDQLSVQLRLVLSFLSHLD